MTFGSLCVFPTELCRAWKAVLFWLLSPPWHHSIPELRFFTRERFLELSIGQGCFPWIRADRHSHRTCTWIPDSLRRNRFIGIYHWVVFLACAQKLVISSLLCLLVAFLCVYPAYFLTIDLIRKFCPAFIYIRWKHVVIFFWVLQSTNRGSNRRLGSPVQIIKYFSSRKYLSNWALVLPFFPFYFINLQILFPLSQLATPSLFILFASISSLLFFF